jgi:Tol biopolymer transport system component
MEVVGSSSGSKGARGAAASAVVGVLLLFSSIFLAGCMRAGFGPRGGDADPSGDGAAVDGTGGSGETSASDGGRACTYAGTFSFTTPVAITTVNSSSNEGEPILLPDGLTLTFSSTRSGSGDLYFATRSSRGGEFSNVTRWTSLDTSSGEGHFSTDSSGLLAAFASDRYGGAGRSDIWVGSRSSTSVAWKSTLFSAPAVLNTSDDEWDPQLSPDGLRIYFTAYPFAGGAGKRDIVVASRADSTAAFSAPVLVGGVNGTSNDHNQALTADELVIVFVSDRTGGKGSGDLYVATRASRADSFSTPKAIPVVNTAANECEVFVSGDGCELFFGSDRSGGKGGLDLYRAVYSE